MRILFIENPFEKDIIAETGNINAQNKMAQCYINGWGVEKKSEKGIYWRNKAADLGDAEAMEELASYYLNGLCGLEKDEIKAFDLYKKSAELGNCRAQVRMGYYYLEDSDMIALDIETAKMWFAKATAQGDEYAAYQLKKLSSNRFVNMDENVIPKKIKKFAKISKANLKIMLEQKWEELNEDYGNEAIMFIPSVQNDLKTIYFNGENCDKLNEKIPEKNSLRGFHTLNNDLTFWGGIANGDWEVPLFFLVYYDGKKLRGYVPFHGNLVNLDAKTAFGSEVETKVYDLDLLYPEAEDDEYFDFTTAYLIKHNAHNIKRDDLEINWEAIKKELLRVFQEKVYK